MSNIPAERQQVLASLAGRLATAWKSASMIDEPDENDLPRDRDEAYFVQDSMAQIIGHPLSGWKVGATSARMRELDGHDDVIPGRIFKSVTWEGNEWQLPVSRFPHARVETEFAFRLHIDLPVRSIAWTATELAPHVTLHPAIELIGNRHELPNGSAAQRSLMTIADNGGGIGFVFGAAVENWQHIEFKHHVITLKVDGQPAAENFLGDMRCNPLDALIDLTNHLSQRGIGLKKNDFVSTGAATVPQTFSGDSQVQADFGELGTLTLSFK